MFLAPGQLNEFYSEIVCLGAAADHTYAAARCHAALCHTGKSSERTGNTVTSVFPCGVRLREGSGLRYEEEEPLQRGAHSKKWGKKLGNIRNT